MNKKFFAALASATMAFTASGSIAVFADDFVEEKNPVIDNGDVTPTPEKVLWNEDNFGALVKLDQDDFQGYSGEEKTLVKGKTVKATDLAKVAYIDLDGLKGEIKGLEYFTGLTSFTDAQATLTNTKLDFSANTKLQTLTLTKAADLTEIVLPEPFIDADDGDKEVYSLATLYLTKTALTSLDLSEQNSLTSVNAFGNNNLKEVKVQHGTKKTPREYTTLNLSDNNLTTIDLDYVSVTGEGAALNLSNNHIGALDLSLTTIHKDATPGFGGQKFYVSETLKNVNLAETFENFDKAEVVEQDDYNKKTGVITLSENGATYEYKTTKGKLVVSLIPANPMNRLYNPNSGEHFYTADIKEKEALVALGWNDEGYGWVAPKTGDGEKTVFRLYNPNAGDHHYTTSAQEKNTLVAYGWKYEGEGWESAPSTNNVRVYRQYNPYANGAGSHNYTTDKAENDYLVSLGWTPEGTAWFALQ